MGMTVVEKILARSAGLPSVKVGRCGGTEGGPRHVPRERGAGDQPVPGGLPGHRAPGEGLGSVPGRHHLRPSRAGGIAQDRHQPEEDPRFRGGTRHHEIPRHPRRRGWHLPPDPPRVRLRPAGLRGGGDRLPHHQPWGHGCLQLRHRRHGDGLGVEPGHRCEHRSARHHQGRGEGRVPALRGAQGPHPPPHREAHGPGGQLQGAGVPRRDHPEDEHQRPHRHLQHERGGRRHLGHRSRGRGDPALPAGGSGGHRSHPLRHARPGRQLRPDGGDRRDQAGASDRLPPYGGQREAHR